MGKFINLIRNLLCHSNDLKLIHLMDLVHFTVRSPHCVDDLGQIKKYLFAVPLNYIRLNILPHYYPSLSHTQNIDGIPDPPHNI